MIPVSVITGFLGSGKTTLLKRLLAHPRMGATAVLVNELGEVELDHLLLRKVDEDIVLLNSGVCAARCATIWSRRSTTCRRGARPGNSNSTGR